MPLLHALVRIDRHAAKLLSFDAEAFQIRKVTAHRHDTVQHHNDVRSEHGFFAEVCDSLAGMTKVLIAGSHDAQAAFRHYVEKHRPQTVALIVGWETVDHPTEGQLLAMARRYFVDHERGIVETSAGHARRH